MRNKALSFNNINNLTIAYDSSDFDAINHILPILHHDIFPCSRTDMTGYGRILYKKKDIIKLLDENRLKFFKSRQYRNSSINEYIRKFSVILSQ